ncbi:hypothetical protein BCEP27_11896 [Burkholderia cepacia]
MLAGRCRRRKPSARLCAVPGRHSRKRGLQRRRFQMIGQIPQRGRADRRHPRLLHVRRLRRILRAHAHAQRRDRPAALLQIAEQPRLDLPQPRGQRIVRGKEGQGAVLHEAGFDVVRQVIGQERGKIALQRRDLLDAGAQCRERVGAAEHFGHGLRAIGGERAETLGKSVHRDILRARTRADVDADCTRAGPCTGGFRPVGPAVGAQCPSGRDTGARFPAC